MSLVSFLSTGRDPGTMNVSQLMMQMRDHGVILIAVVLGSIVSPGNLVLYSVVIIMYNLFLVEVCKTPCKFPFTYGGTQHDGCITHDNDGTPWCDIGNGEKGNCSSECPGKLVLTIGCHNYNSLPLFS